MTNNETLAAELRTVVLNEWKDAYPDPYTIDVCERAADALSATSGASAEDNRPSFKCEHCGKITRLGIRLPPPPASETAPLEHEDDLKLNSPQTNTDGG